MQKPVSAEVPTLAGPSFYITGRQSLSPGAILLATVAAVGALYLGALYAGSQRTYASQRRRWPFCERQPAGAPAADEKDDPYQIDTIVLGDPADAPVPAPPGRPRQPCSRDHPRSSAPLRRAGGADSRHSCGPPPLRLACCLQPDELPRAWQCSAQCRARLRDRGTDRAPATDRRLQSALCQRGPARRPCLPTPRPDALGDRGPWYPPGASELQPRRYREL